MQWLIDLFQSFFKTEKTPEQEFQEKLDQGVESLKVARLALEESRKLVEETQRGIQCSQDDVRSLNHIIKSCVQLNNNVEARKHAQRLLEEEAELAQKELELKQRLEDYDAALKSIEKFQQELKVIERDAKTRALNISLANFRKESASVALDLHGSHSNLINAEIDARARAKIEDRENPEVAWEEINRQDQITQKLKEFENNC